MGIQFFLKVLSRLSQLKLPQISTQTFLDSFVALSDIPSVSSLLIEDVTFSCKACLPYMPRIPGCCGGVCGKHRSTRLQTLLGGKALKILVIVR